MHCSLVNVESILALEYLATHMAGVEEQSWEVDCLQVMFHFGWKLGLESVTESTVILLDILVTDHIQR